MEKLLNQDKNKSDLAGSTAIKLSRNDSPPIVETPPVHWILPNDRELMIRAKLKTGWSSRSQNQNQTLQTKLTNTFNKQQATPISELEINEIENVLKRAQQAEKKELTRITKLYERFEFINRPQGNGKTACFVCGNLFGTFSSQPRVCNICSQNCCITCSVDTASSAKHTKWICKICSEYREFYKKSGAWFHKQIPLNEIKTKQKELQSSKSPSSNVSLASNFNSNKTNEVSSINASISSSSAGGLSGEYMSKNKKTRKNQSLEDDDDDNDNEDDEENDEIDYDLAAADRDTEVNDDVISDHIRMNHDRESNKNNNNDTESNHLSADCSIENPLHSSPNSKLNSKQMDSISLSAVVDTTQTSSINELAITKTDNTIPIKLTPLQEYELLKAKPMPLPPLQPPSQLQRFTSFIESKPQNASTTSSNTNSASRSSATTKGAAIPKALSLREPSINRNNHNDSNLGSIRFTILYISSTQQLKIHILGATNLPPRDANGLSDPYVKLHLLPGLAKSTKLRSKTVYKTLNPKFNETLSYDAVSIDDLNTKTLRLTVLDEDKIGFDNIGEYRLPLKILQINEENYFDVKLQQIKDLGDDLSTEFRGKINFSLKYSKVLSVLYVKINRCTQLLPMDNGKSSDPYVQITLKPSVGKLNKQHKQRTSVKWKTLDPEYNEEFKFENIDLKTLIDKIIEISVWDKDFGSSDFIGCVKIGQKSCGDELTHFFTMIKNPGIYHEHWHTLKEN